MLHAALCRAMMKCEASPDRRRGGTDLRVRGAAVEAVVDRNEASALADLQMHWDEAYAVGFDGDVWSARFHGSTDELCARTSSDLRELIRADYVHRQRPRRPAPPNGGGHAGDRQAGDSQADDPQAGEDDGHLADDAAPAPGGSAEAASDAVQSDCVSDRAAEPLGGRVDFASIRGERMST
jgi:hypothetical protein